jgi:hypothetical protein
MGRLLLRGAAVLERDDLDDLGAMPVHSAEYKCEHKIHKLQDPFCHSERSEESLCLASKSKKDSSLRSE